MESAVPKAFAMVDLRLSYLIAMAFGVDRQNSTPVLILNVFLLPLKASTVSLLGQSTETACRS